MASYEALSHYFNYSWNHVVACFWKKYPNEYSTHVLYEDVLDRKIIAGNKLYTKRILGKTNPLPKWGNRVFPSHMTKVAHLVEESIVDVSNQAMTVYTWNINFNTFMEIKDKMILTRDTSDMTSCNREAWADSSTLGFRRVLRKFGISRWKSNTQKSFVGYEKVLTKFDEQGTGDGEQETDSKILKIPVFGGTAIETLKDAKDKAKNKAIDFASMATVKNASKETC